MDNMDECISDAFKNLLNSDIEHHRDVQADRWFHKTRFRNKSENPNISRRKCLLSNSLPKLPQWETGNGTNRKADVDFIKRNVKSAQNLRSKPPTKYVVDSSQGHKFLADDINAKHIFHENFGKVPSYILRRRREMEGCRVKSRNDTEDKVHQYKRMDDQERKYLLKGLKEKFNQINKSYSRLPLFIDNITLINKKKNIEQQLQEIEQYIKFLEKNNNIYIYE